MFSKLKTRWHRLGPKAAPPAGRLSSGLFGAGQFFHYAYAPALNQSASPLVIAGILTRDEARFQSAQRALRYPVKAFREADALLVANLQAALVLLPNHLHFEIVRQALERGLHVFCEKPLAQNVAEALALKAIAEKSGRVLMVDFNQRYLDRDRVLKQVVAEARLGKILSVRAFHNQDLRGLKSFAPLHREITGGGVIHNAGIHFINLFLHWFGDVAHVSARFENRALPVECGEDTAHCRFWFRNGVTATLDASLAGAVDTTYERVEFTGTDGELSSDLKKGNILCRHKSNPQLKIPCRAEIMSDSVFNALDHFAQCVKKGARPETGVDDFIKTMKVIEALTLSAREHGAEIFLD